MEYWVVNSQHTKAEFFKHVENLFDKNHYLNFTWTTGKQRTTKQNSSLHLWLNRLANALNDAGFDMKKVLKPSVDIPWTKDSTKEYLWRPIQIAICGEESTTEAEKIDYVKTYETLNRHLSMKFGVSIEWPSSEDKTVQRM